MASKGIRDKEEQIIRILNEVESGTTMLEADQPVSYNDCAH